MRNLLWIALGVLGSLSLAHAHPYDDVGRQNAEAAGRAGVLASQQNYAEQAQRKIAAYQNWAARQHGGLTGDAECYISDELTCSEYFGRCLSYTSRTHPVPLSSITPGSVVDLSACKATLGDGHICYFADRYREKPDRYVPTAECWVPDHTHQVLFWLEGGDARPARNFKRRR